jgi:hypothetical protein
LNFHKLKFFSIEFIYQSHAIMFSNKKISTTMFHFTYFIAFH